MSILRWGLPSVDPWFGITDVLGDYDRQMRQMTREFNRLENQLLGGQEDFLGPQNLISLLDRSAIVPRIVDKDGQQVAEYTFDIKGFRPEEVQIKTTGDNRLCVSASHEEKGEDYQVSRRFERSVLLPEGIKLEEMQSQLRNDGVLAISAPLIATAASIESKEMKEIPIHHEHQKSIQQQGQQQPGGLQKLLSGQQHFGQQPQKAA